MKEFPLSLNFCTKLNFSYNEIPNFVSSFVFMTTLKLSHNKLTSVPSLESLKNLNMSHNKIKKLPKMSNSVENLDFSFNRNKYLFVRKSEEIGSFLQQNF